MVLLFCLWFYHIVFNPCVLCLKTKIRSKNQNLYYTRDNTPKRVTSDGAHLRDVATRHSGQHSSEETSQRWRAAGVSVSDLTGPEMKP